MSYSIGTAVSILGIPADTLRYYEKIGLASAPPRNASGRRLYGEKDLARLRFIKRAQSLGFSLSDIAKLLRLRENPTNCSKVVRALAEQKREELVTQIKDIEHMHRELSLLLNLCTGTGVDCPILERMEASTRRKERSASKA